MAGSAGRGLVTVNELLDGQVVLDVECLDRIYLSGFVNSLQTPGGVIYFLHHHRGMPIASPAVFTGIGERFRRSVSSFAEANHIPVVRSTTSTCGTRRSGRRSSRSAPTSPTRSRSTR